MPLAIAVANAFGRPTADSIDDVDRTFNGAESIPQAVAEGVDDATIRHSWLQPFVQCRTGGVGIAFDFAAVFGESEGRAVLLDPMSCPE